MKEKEKKDVYIRCPRCELNYILKKDKLCNVCKAELKVSGGSDDLIAVDMDYEVCPFCKINYISSDDEMCSSCSKERSVEFDSEDYVDTEWKNYLGDEEEVEKETDGLSISTFEEEDAETLDEEDDIDIGELALDDFDEDEEDVDVSKSIEDEFSDDEFETDSFGFDEDEDEDDE